jgi:bifunctional N-acetylglucosamine-1-phosphate-uridyltransferase/glucosamine-1-phosphate-acetyltransferase GlmU-like protein
MAKKKQPIFTFEGNLCFKDGQPYGRIVEENESHRIVEVKNENPNEYPQRHEFRKEAASE